jgi:hypothetical protein
VIKAMTSLTKLLTWKLGVVIGALLMVSAVAIASSDDDEAPSGRTPKPVIEHGKGDKCVEDEAYMRRNHMKLLMHQRDNTVHNGIRTTKYSLKQCIDCHASQKTGSVIASDENFCVSCHTYAAVKIDCFECHSGKPKAAAAPAAAYFHPIVAPSAKDNQAPANRGLVFGTRPQMAAGSVGITSAGASK